MYDCTTPTRTKITLGQNVRKASIPKPTGFGLGSLVTPNHAHRMTVNNGPLPRINRINPIQSTRERRNFGLRGCSISGGWPDSQEGFVSMSGCLSPVHFLYTNTMPTLSIVKVLPSMVPVVIPAPCHCMVSLEPSLV